MKSMEAFNEIVLGKPPSEPRLHHYMMLSATLLLTLLFAGAMFWNHYSRLEPEELVLSYHQPAVDALGRMVEEANRLNERLLDDAWSGRTLIWDKGYRTRHYDHLSIMRKRLDALLLLENRYGRRIVPMPEKEPLLRSIEGRLLAVEEEWATAGVVTALVFHEFATRELPVLASELVRLRRLHEEAGRALQTHMDTEQAFELQVLMFMASMLLLLALWGVRRGLHQIQKNQGLLVRYDQALAASRLATRLLQTTARYFPWEMDASGTRFEGVDAGLMTWLGRGAEAWVGLEDWSAVIHPMDRELAMTWRTDLARGEADSSRLDYRVVKADGEVVWLRDLLAMRPGGADEGYRGYFVDVTEEKHQLTSLQARFADDLVRLEAEKVRLEEEQAMQEKQRVRLEKELFAVQSHFDNIKARLWSILDHAQVGITLKNLEGHYLIVNRCFETWFGVDPVFPAEMIQEFAQREREVLEDGEIRLTEEVWSVGESKGLFSVARFPLRDGDGQILGLFVIMVDLTDRKILEEELLGELVLARAHARQVGRAQSRCLAAMGREVPSLVRGMARMIERLQESGPPARQQGRLELLAQSVASLQELVEDLQLGFTQTKVVPEGENFDLLLMLEETAGIFSRYAIGSGKRLHGRIGQGVPRAVRGDAERLRRLLAIMLGGAIHSSAIGEVLFSVQSHPTDSYRLLFQVPAGVMDAEREDDLAILERLATDMGGGCHFARPSGDVISVIVPLQPTFIPDSGSIEDEPHDEFR